MEQRRNRRIAVDSRLMLAIPGFGLASVRASNVSADGACVQIARPALALAVGTLVQVVYVFGNDASVKHRHVRALVIRASGGCCGLAFTSLGSETTDMVNEMQRTGSWPLTVPAFEAWQIAWFEVPFLPQPPPSRPD